MPEKPLNQLRIKNTSLVLYEEPREILHLMVNSKRVPMKVKREGNEGFNQRRKEKLRSINFCLCLPRKIDTIN